MHGLCIQAFHPGHPESTEWGVFDTWFIVVGQLKFNQTVIMLQNSRITLDTVPPVFVEPMLECVLRSCQLTWMRGCIIVSCRILIYAL